MVEAGIGLTVMPRLAVPPGGLHGLAVRPLLPRLERTVMLVRRHDRALSPVAERVWRIVERHRAQQADATRRRARA